MCFVHDHRQQTKAPESKSGMALICGYTRSMGYAFQSKS